jgi:hypothetical protein
VKPLLPRNCDGDESRRAMPLPNRILDFGLAILDLIENLKSEITASGGKAR